MLIHTCTHTEHRSAIRTRAESKILVMYWLRVCVYMYIYIYIQICMYA